MSARDRTVLILIVVLAALGGGYVLLVSPERKQASKLATQVSEAKTQLETAEGALAHARQAQAQYTSAYASIVNLGKAVPTSQQVPSLIYQIAQASGGKNVRFTSIVAGGAGSSPSSTPSAPAAAAAVGAGFSQLPFTFVFEGGFGDLEHLFHQLDGFAKRTTTGLVVNGRLLTIQSIKLSPATTGIVPTGKGPHKLTGTVSATAYILPATQGLTGGANAAPAGTAPAGAGSPTAPAIARVTP